MQAVFQRSAGRPNCRWSASSEYHQRVQPRCHTSASEFESCEVFRLKTCAITAQLFWFNCSSVSAELNYIFKIFSNLCFFSKCGKVSVSSKAFGLVPFCSILFLLLLVRSVIMTGLPRECHGSCTDTVEQCTVHIAAGPARAQLE